MTPRVTKGNNSRVHITQQLKHIAHPEEEKGEISVRTYVRMYYTPCIKTCNRETADAYAEVKQCTNVRRIYGLSGWFEIVRK